MNPQIEDNLFKALGSLTYASMLLDEYEKPGNSARLRELIYRERIILREAMDVLAQTAHQLDCVSEPGIDSPLPVVGARVCG